MLQTYYKQHHYHKKNNYANMIGWCVFGSMFAIFVYILMCVWELSTFQANIEVLALKLKKENGEVTTLERGVVFNANHGDTIQATIRAFRNYTGKNKVERKILDSQEREQILTIVHKNYLNGQTSIFQVDYPVPFTTSSGCYATVFSHNHYSFDGNLLSHIFPLPYKSPQISFCIN